MSVETADVQRRIAAALADAVERIADPTPEVTAATRRRRVARADELREIGTVLERSGHVRAGHRSPASWLAQVTGESVGHCMSTVTVVRRLPEMPLVRASFDEGDLAESSLRLLAEAWHPSISDVFARDEEMLLRWATSFAHADFKKLLDTWRAHADHGREVADSAEQYERRSLHVSKMLDGMGKLDGVLDREGLSLVREALRALARPAGGDQRTPSQRRADALVDMARIALDSVDEREKLDRTADGETLFGPSLPERRSKRNRPKVFASIAYESLASGDGAGLLDTNLDHSIVPAETIRRMACDAGIHRYVTDPLGTVIDHGRNQRVVSDRQFDRLHLRDHGCRWTGCGVPAAGCDAHHAVHWLDDGETVDDNLVLLCWHHHHLLHEQHWSIQPLGAGHFVLTQPDGSTLLMRPPMVGLALPLS